MKAHTLRRAAAACALLISGPTLVAADFGPDLFAPTRAAGQALDQARVLPLTPFYNAAAEPGAPGTLVASESFTGYLLPQGVRAVRILYASQAADGRAVLASGVVLTPYGEPPPDGWPVLAWAHGTSGVARSCAPSLMKSLYYNWAGLFQYVSLGYAVVATDYAGLGVPGHHAYIDMESNGADVAHSVPAARAAVPGLGVRWIAVGHSQGGLAVLGVAQLEGRLRDPNFLGTVSLAGASDLQDGVESMLAFGQPVLNGLMGFIVFGAHAIEPRIAAQAVLTDQAAAVYAAHVEDGCSAASAVFSAVPTAGMYRADWKGTLQRFLARNRPGVQAAHEPLFVATGWGVQPCKHSRARKVRRRRKARAGRPAYRRPRKPARRAPYSGPLQPGCLPSWPAPAKWRRC